MNPKCIVEGCHNKALRRPEHSPHSTLCNKHYALVPRIKIKGRLCSVTGCGKKHFGKGLCVFHYNEVNLSRRMEHRRKLWAKIKADPNAPLCSIGGCPNKAFRQGLCQTHYTYERPSYREKYGSQATINRLPKHCQVCGYNKMPCSRHRLNPSLGYILGNVVIVCANCHKEIHAGLTPCPQPYTSVFNS